MGPQIRASLSDIRTAERALETYRRYLEPGRPSDILIEVTLLLESFPARDRHPALEKALAERWTMDLSDLPFHAIRHACSFVRRTRIDYSPRLGEIRQAAANYLGFAYVESHLLSRIVAAGNPAIPAEEPLSQEQQDLFTEIAKDLAAKFKNQK